MSAAGAAQVNASPHGHNCARRYLWVWIYRKVTLRRTPPFYFLVIADGDVVHDGLGLGVCGLRLGATHNLVKA